MSSYFDKNCTGYLTTDEIAEWFKVKPATVRRGLCTKGHYLGVTPKKTPNGRLFWPVKDAREVLEGIA